MRAVECAEVRAALSARLDGEETTASEEIIDAHVAECEECQAWYAEVTAIGRNLRMSIDPPQPGAHAGEDMAQKVLRAAEEFPEISGDLRRRQLPLMISRIALGTLAIVYFIWAILLFAGSTIGTSEVPMLPGAAEGDGPVAGAADPVLASYMVDGAVSRFALGAGLAWAAWAPRAAGGLLPVYLGMWAFGAGFATRDIVLGIIGAEQLLSAQLWTLAIHLFAVIALVACWLSRHHAVQPLRESWRLLSAKPMNFSQTDAAENSTFWPGDHRPPRSLE